MAEGLLSNGSGAFRVVSDFRLGKDADGFALSWPQMEVIADAPASGAVAVGDLCIRVLPTQTAPLRYSKSLGADQQWTIAGVATAPAGTTGKSVTIVSRGFCFVNVGAATPAAGDIATIGATAGQAGVIAAATGIAATLVLGSVLGHYLGAKDANNLAPVWFVQL